MFYLEPLSFLLGMLILATLQILLREDRGLRRTRKAKLQNKKAIDL